MPMLRTCSAPGCSTLTLSDLCLAHEPPRRAAADSPPAAHAPVLPVVVTAVAAAGAGILAGSRLTRRPRAGVR